MLHIHYTEPETSLNYGSPQCQVLHSLPGSNQQYFVILLAVVDEMFTKKNNGRMLVLTVLYIRHLNYSSTFRNKV